jgi:hypothetical protein
VIDGLQARFGLGRTEPLPVVGDRLVCLRNDRQKKILNGELFDVVPAPPKLPGERKKARLKDPDAVDLWVASEDAPAGLTPAAASKVRHPAKLEDHPTKGLKDFLAAKPVITD